jgi:hypothetical protein
LRILFKARIGYRGLDKVKVVNICRYVVGSEGICVFLVTYHLVIRNKEHQTRFNIPGQHAENRPRFRKMLKRVRRKQNVPSALNRASQNVVSNEFATPIGGSG